jgi:hypothetical protein
MNKFWPRATAFRRLAPRLMKDARLPVLAELEADKRAGGWAAGYG